MKIGEPIVTCLIIFISFTNFGPLKALNALGKKAINKKAIRN